MPPHHHRDLHLLHFLLLLLFHLFSTTNSLDFLFNTFNTSATQNLILIPEARVVSSVVTLTNDTNPISFGRVFHTTKIQMINNTTSDNTLSSFSTSFVFSILPDISSSPGFGLAFVLSNWTNPPNALASQYFGLFSNNTRRTQAPLLAVEFDTGRNSELNDPNDNHIGINLNYIESQKTEDAGYYNSTGAFVPIYMRSGENVHAWIDFDGVSCEINVTVAPLGVSRPNLPTLNYRNPVIANYVSSEMFVGFSASKTQWVEAQRVLAWSFSDLGVAREINVTGLPVFRLESQSSSLSAGAIAGIVIACVVFVVVCGVGVYWFLIRKRFDEEDEIEDWELEYWPHRFPYEELSVATDGFSNDQLLGSGGFGKVYKGTLSKGTDIAVKCVNHDSKQGVREFMAEISSMGRLQHKNLVQLRGWCRRSNELLLVYDYMPNGSLDRYIYNNNKSKKNLNWPQRRRVLADVAEGLNYLHSGWEKVVVHRDIKSSNILLDADMRGRLGDFGLAKLYSHNEVPNTTRVVGTLGYLAPELATVAVATCASDVYSFGVVILEVACGRKPIEIGALEEDDRVLVIWVRDMYANGKMLEAADERMKGEFRPEEMETVLKLGLACCHPEPQKRPTMREVVAVLLGEEVTAAPGAMLTDLARGGGEHEDVATVKDEVPV